MSLDDLIQEKKEKKKGGLDALLQRKQSESKTGLDALIKRKSIGTEVVQPIPTLTPTPFPATPPPGNLERATGIDTVSEQERERERLRATGLYATREQADRAFLEETGRIPGLEQSGQAIPTKELETAAVTATSLLFPPIAVGPAFLGTVGRTALGSGIVGGAENMAIETGAALAERSLPDPKELAISGLTGFGFGGVAGGVSAKVFGKTGDNITFGRKVKDIADYHGTSPSQVNKYLKETAEQLGTDRGTIADEVIGHAVKTQPEGAQAFAKYLDEVAENVPASTRMPAENLLPENFNVEAVTRELDPFQTPRVAPVKTLKNVNLSRMDDEQLSRFIDSTVQQSPEFRIPNEVVAHDVLKERARRFGTGTIEKYLEDVNALAPGTPEADIRRIASEVLAAEDVLKAHMEGETMNLARLVAEGKGDRGALRDALVADLRLLRKTGGVSSEFGRALGSRRIKATGEMGMEQRFLREVNKVIGKDANLDQIATRVSQIDIFDPTARQLFLRDLVHATTREKIDEIFYNSILSGIITQGRNIAGNVGVIITREAERPFATAADAVSSLVTGRQRQRYFSESAKAAFGLIEGTREGLNAGWKSFMTEVPQFGLEAGIMSDLPAQRIGGAIRGTKGRIFRLPSRALMATDDFFKAVAYRMELNARAYREARNVARANNWTSEQMLDLYNHLRYHPTDPLIRGARDEALIRTFQTPAGEIGQAMVQARDKVPGLRYFMPFVRTPLNIMEFGVERIPGVNLLSILNRSRQGLPIDWTEEFAKTAIGTMIAGGVYLAHQRGAINGFGPNERTGEEKAFLTSGRQRYSINIGDTSISFQNFEPFSTMLGFMADTFDAIDSGIPIISEDMALNIGKSLGRNLTEKSFGMGLDTALNFMTGDFERGKAGLVRTASSFVPFSSLTRSAAISMDPTVRRVQSLGDAFKGNIPGLRGDLEPVLDIWGNEVVTEAGVLQRMAEAAGIHADIPGQMLRIRELSEDPATKEVFRLSQRFPDEPFTGLGTPKREIKGIELTREEYVAYVKAAGQLAHQGVTQFMGSNVYPRLPDEIKKKQIEKIILKAREQARNRFLYEKRKSGALKQ